MTLHYLKKLRVHEAPDDSAGHGFLSPRETNMLCDPSRRLPGALPISYRFYSRLQTIHIPWELLTN
jgi:hypothetical protein